MDILKFFIGAFFALGGIIIPAFHSHVGRSRELIATLFILSILNAFLAGGFLSGARDRGEQQKRLLSGFAQYREPWSIGGEKPEITNAGAFLLITLCINLLISNLIGFDF
ncbi:MAG TPA: hypothetical protein PLU07_10445 [Ferruginibacter sp.]|nr:hypothetical protein [Ferruginibacter sp.]